MFSYQLVIIVRQLSQDSLSLSLFCAHLTNVFVALQNGVSAIAVPFIFSGENDLAIGWTGCGSIIYTL